jgi:hypothetical protein
MIVDYNLGVAISGMNTMQNYELYTNPIFGPPKDWGQVVMQNYYATSVASSAPPERSRRDKLILLTIKTILT